MFYRIFLLLLIGFTHKISNNFLNINNFIHKYFNNQHQYINKKQFIKMNQYKKLGKNVINGIGVLETKKYLSNNSPDSNRKWFTNFYIFKKWNPINFILNLVQYFYNKKFSNTIGYYKSIYSFIQQNKSIFSTIIEYQFDKFIYKPLQYQQFEKNTTINKLLENSGKTQNIFMAKTRQLKNIYHNNQKNLNSKKYNHFYQTVSLTKEILINPNFYLKFKSYKTIFAENKINKIKNNYNSFFTINWFCVLKKQQDNENYQYQWKFLLDFNLNSSSIYKDIFINNYNNYQKKQIHHHQYLINKAKDEISTENFKNKKKSLDHLKKRTHQLKKTMDNFKKTYELKYKNNFLNQRTYYEFLLTHENLVYKIFQMEEKFLKYCWKIFLKNPHSKIHLKPIPLDKNHKN